MSATELDVCMDLLDVVIDTTNARAELAALRARADEVTALQQAVHEAREIMATVCEEAFQSGSHNHLMMKKYVRDRCEAWLAAHPAPEQVTT